MSTKKASKRQSLHSLVSQSSRKPEDIYAYLKWAALLCFVLTVFGLGIFLVGYKDLSIGRTMTLCVLFIISLVCFIGARRIKKKFNL